MVYGWTLLASFWKVPSWMFYLKIHEILSVYAYSFVIDFVESVLLLFIALLVGLILPRRWWNAQFTTQGVLWIVVLMGSVMLRLYTNRTPENWEGFVYDQGGWWGITFLIGLVLSFIASRASWFRSGLDALAERLVSFLFIYLPLTLLSFIVVLVRIAF